VLAVVILAGEDAAAAALGGAVVVEEEEVVGLVAQRPCRCEEEELVDHVYSASFLEVVWEGR
jgi:hypothetical protein